MERRGMSILFMFPGQGSQRAGMLHALPGDPAVAQTLTEAGDMLGVNPLTLDTAEALRSTVAVQLCLLIAGVAVARTLARQDAGPDMVAGLSIGAWPAAVVAGVLEFSDVLRLVRLRGQLMEDAYPSGYGMVAIIGLAEPEVSGIVAQVNTTDTPATTQRSRRSPNARWPTAHRRRRACAWRCRRTARCLTHRLQS
jgi:malonate decarboxylase epsilon subunit